MDTLHALAWMFFACMLSPVIFIALDYWSGTRKARRNGIPLMSHGMRKSVSKACTYYNALLALAMVDSLQIFGVWYWNEFYEHHYVLFPFFTAAGALCVAAIEIKSIMESADEKAKKQASEVMDLATSIAKSTDPRAIAAEIIKYMKDGVVTETDSASA